MPPFLNFERATELCRGGGGGGLGGVLLKLVLTHAHDIGGGGGRSSKRDSIASLAGSSVAKGQSQSEWLPGVPGFREHVSIYLGMIPVRRIRHLWPSSAMVAAAARRWPAVGRGLWRLTRGAWPTQRAKGTPGGMAVLVPRECTGPLFRVWSTHGGAAAMSAACWAAATPTQGR